MNHRRAVLSHGQVVFGAPALGLNDGCVHTESTTWRPGCDVVVHVAACLIQPSYLWAHAGQGVQCVHDDRAAVVQVERAVVWERELGGSAVCRAQAHADPDFCAVVGRHPCPIAGLLNLDALPFNGEKGHLGGRDVTPDVSTSKTDDEDEGQRDNPDDGP